MAMRTTLLAAAAAVGMSASAFAVPIAAGSQLNISGFDIGQGGGATIDQATGLDFLTSASAAASPGTPGVLDSVSGSLTFAALGCTTNCGTIKDILSFTNFASTSSFYATTSGVSFDLNALTDITRLSANQGRLATLVVSGTGVFRFDGFDPTPGIFTLTTQGGTTTTFSASTIAQAVPSAVPEPASMALLGVGLAGLGFIRRRKS